MSDYSIKPERAKIYSHYKKLPPKKAAAIMLGTDPEQVDKYHFSNTPQGIDVNLLANLLEVKAFDGDFTDIEKDSYYDFGEEIEYVKSISASELKEWALSNGYQWLGENQINHTSLHQKTSDEANTSQERITKLEQDSLIEIDSINQEDNNKKDRTIEELQAKITELENQLQARQSAVNSESILEYEGDLPESTNADKLADFIELIIDPELRDDKRMPTYSRLYSKLDDRHRGKRPIPSKNTIKKYLNQ